MSLPQGVMDAFEAHYGYKPAYLVRAPGRVNLIGEHTDYNEGFVFPMAIDRNVWLAAAPRVDTTVHAYSMDLGSSFEMDTAQIGSHADGWGRYVQGVAWALREGGHQLMGWDGVITSDVPIGSGLSSSAALELAVARCFAKSSEIVWNASPMAVLCQKAENQWVGMNCGIMDQLIIAEGKRDHALLMDCRSLELKPVRMPQDVVVVIMDTATRRGLVDSAYNERRQQCETASRFFGVPYLRDVSLATFEQKSHALSEALQMRSRHVISENERTTASFEAMVAGDVIKLGQLMDESHTSLRDDYEVTNEALDTIVTIARSHGAALGARMTGAGFGGCAIALVKKEEANDFATYLSEAYQQQTGLTPSVYVCQAEQGVSVEDW
ncbi:MAG: galactokinase [Rhodothermales bacterium]